MTKTFWLSFADGDRPEGQQFLGVVIVDVDEDDAAEALAFIKDNPHKFPKPQEGAEWIGAASTMTHQMACNPGGNMMALELNPERTRHLPRNRLLSAAALIELGVKIEHPE